MKLTKEDYMCLPKERLAELLAEMDSVEPIVAPSPGPNPFTPVYPPATPCTPWWNDQITATGISDNSSSYEAN